jgi:hypothetical protein
MERHTSKNVTNCLSTNVYSYLETSSGQSSNLYLNVVSERYPFLELSSIQNVWAKHQANREKHHFWLFPKIFADWSKMPSINCSQMCFSIPQCLWMLTDAIIGVDQHTHTHTHTLSLSLSLHLFALFPHLFVSDKNPHPRLFDYHWKYRFHRVRLFSFHR